MVDLQSQHKKIRAEIDLAINEVIDSATFINGPAVTRFAKNLADYLKVKHVIPCANGTDALQIAMMAYEFPRGSEIIVPSWTYVATVEVIALLGYVPVFVEVNPETFNIDIEAVRSKITSRTKAIVPVHLYGQCADMEHLLSIAEESNLVVIEDTAQALGADYTFKDGSVKKAGTMGHIGTTSFFPSKNLGCMGDGGAIMTEDSELAEKLRMISNHGQRVKYRNELAGVNSRLDTMQAAILDVKLKYLDSYASARNSVADKYDLAFQNMNLINVPVRSPFSTHVFHQYTLRLSEQINRDQLQQDLKEVGVPTMVYYPIPNHLQPAYVGYGYKVGDMPITEALSNSVISLPIHTEMDSAVQDIIVENVFNCIKRQ